MKAFIFSLVLLFTVFSTNLVQPAFAGIEPPGITNADFVSVDQIAQAETVEFNLSVEAKNLHQINLPNQDHPFSWQGEILAVDQKEALKTPNYNLNRYWCSFSLNKVNPIVGNWKVDFDKLL
jgi:hypothetical protein